MNTLWFLRQGIQFAATDSYVLAVVQYWLQSNEYYNCNVRVHLG